MKRYNIRSGIYAILLAGLTGLVSCAKTEEPPKPVGTSLPYTNTTTRKLAALLDSIPEASIYRAAFKRTGIQQYIDSLNADNGNAYYTLFVPVNKAWEAAGYTMNNINTVPAPELEVLIRYLSITGGIAAKPGSVVGETAYYPFTYPEKPVCSQVPGPFDDNGFYYYHRLSVGMTGGVLRLNGKDVGRKPVIPAVDGAIYLIDSMITKPVYESYQVLSADTAFTFYMGALKKSNELYDQKGILGNRYYNIRFNDTATLVLMTGGTDLGEEPATAVFAPDNNAFRKAGFASIEDVNSYIDGSALALAPPGTEMLTNMDSILVNHRILINAAGNVNMSLTNPYTGCLLSNAWPNYVNNGDALGAITYRIENGRIVLHRQDAPQGRGAVVIGPSDITTLTGVIHRVDNLLLPNP